jgi:predicted transcriptional regulator
MQKYMNKEDFLSLPATQFMQKAPIVLTTDSVERTVGLFQIVPEEIALMAEPGTGILKGVVTLQDIAYLALGLLQNTTFEDTYSFATKYVIAIKEDGTVQDVVNIMNGNNSWLTPCEVVPLINHKLQPIGVFIKSNLILQFSEFSLFDP